MIRPRYRTPRRLWRSQRGPNPKVVQRMLGHTSAAMTLDVYADLFDSDLDAVADRLETLATPSPRRDHERR